MGQIPFGDCATKGKMDCGESLQHVGVMKMASLLRFSTAVLVVAFILPTLPSQELNPLDPTDIRLGVEEADVIVTGEFKVNWFYPWLDGWHYSGALRVGEVLYGDGRVERQIPFRWLEGFGSSCLMCDRLSWFDRRSGIWLLTKKGGSFQFSGTVATLCGEALPMEARAIVVEAIRRRGAAK